MLFGRDVQEEESDLVGENVQEEKYGLVGKNVQKEESDRFIVGKKYMQEGRNDVR